MMRPQTHETQEQQRANSVLMGMYTTEQSFTDAGILDQSADTYNGNFKFGTSRINNGSQYQSVRNMVDEDIIERAHDEDESTRKSELVIAQNQAPPVIETVKKEMCLSEVQQQPADPLAVDDQYQPMETEGDEQLFLKASLFPIDEQMSRDERSFTQRTNMRNSNIQNENQKLPSFVNPQPSILEPAANERSISVQKRNHSMVQDYAEVKSHQGSDQEEDQIEMNFENEQDSIPSSPPTQPSEVRYSSYKELILQVDEKLLEKSQSISSSHQERGLSERYQSKKASEVGPPLDVENEFDDFTEEHKEPMIEDLPRQLEDYDVEAFANFAEGAGEVEQEVQALQYSEGSQGNADFLDDDQEGDFSREEEKQVSQQDEEDSFRSESQSSDQDHQEASSESSVEVRRLITEDFGDEIPQVLDDSNISGLLQEGDSNDQIDLNTSGVKKSWNKSSILSPADLRKRSLLYTDSLTRKDFNKSGLKAPSLTRATEPKKTPYTPKLSSTVPKFARQQTTTSSKANRILNTSISKASTSGVLQKKQTSVSSTRRQSAALTGTLATPRKSNLMLSKQPTLGLTQKPQQLHPGLANFSQSIKKAVLPVSPKAGGTPLMRRNTTFMTPASPASQLNTSVEIPQTRNMRLSNDLKDMPPTFSNQPEQINEMMQSYIKTNRLKVPIEQVDGARYLFGTKIIIASIQNGGLNVRVGGGFMTIEEFIVQHEGNEIFKIRTMSANQKKKIPKIMGELADKYRATKKFVQ